MQPGSLVSSKPGIEGKGAGAGVRRFVTGGSDGIVKIWEYRYALPSYWSLSISSQGIAVMIDIHSTQDKTYSPITELTGHTDWVRDVAWAPTILQKSYIASAAQDKTVRIWTSDPAHPNDWKPTVLNFDAVLWRVSWSLSGNVLAVSGGDNKVSLWKENLKGEWDCVKWIEE